LRLCRFGDDRLGLVEDGSVRDVTRQSEYSSNLDVVASVGADGLVRSHRLSGEAAIMARYRGHVAACRAMVPHGEPLAEIHARDEAAAEAAEAALLAAYEIGDEPEPRPLVLDVIR